MECHCRNHEKNIDKRVILIAKIVRHFALTMITFTKFHLFKKNRSKGNTSSIYLLKKTVLRSRFEALAYETFRARISYYDGLARSESRSLGMRLAGARGRSGI